MIITPSTDPIINLSIELLPEFGFTVQNEPVYGPGSVFQGIVHLKMKESPVAADRIVLTFRGAEHATAMHESSKFLVPLIKNPFFGMQQTLWQRTRDDCLLTERHYQFPFTIQMPMIQFPPSMDHPLYKCVFDLSAKLIRTTFTLPTVMTKRTISYMPCIETSSLKQPIIEKRDNGSLYGAVCLHSLQYVPGDTVPITIMTSRRCSRRRRRRRERQQPLLEPTKVNSISVELCETVALKQCKSVFVTRTVASSSHVTCKPDGAESYKVALPLPVDLTPSFHYSKMVNVSYVLRINIKKNVCSVLGAMFNSVIHMELPLTIGTLGYGIRASPDLQVYYADTAQSSPRFLRALEYEESLPLYESVKLPSYHDTMAV